MANHQWKTISMKRVRKMLKRILSYDLSIVGVVIDEGTSHGVDQDSKDHGHGGVGEDNKVHN